MQTIKKAVAPCQDRNSPFQTTCEASISAAPSRCNNSELTPRLIRLSKALLSAPRTVRELADLIPTNNAPEYVKQLRSEHGLEIPCERVKFTTVDGISSFYGLYSLTESDRAKLLAMLEAHE